jgi:hypothetical protein
MNTIKTNIIGFAAFILFTGSCTFAQNADIPDEQTNYGDSVVSMDTFRDKLSSSGQWIAIDSNDIDADAIHADPNAPDNNQDNQVDNNNQSDNNEDYGYDDNVNKDICWRPDGVDYDWNPYTCGNWSYTNCGWMWNSCDNWGWYTDHYGRWWWSVRWGWVWSPGYVWAPCWVSWDYCNDYVGWYPLSPRIRCRGHFRYDVSRYHFKQNNWTFVETKNFTSTITPKTIVKINKNSPILKDSKVVNNIYISGNKVINKGPNVREIQKSTGTKVTTENVNKFTEQNKNYIAKQSGEKSVNKNATVGTKGNRNDNTNVRGNEKGYRPNKSDGNKKDGNNNYGNKRNGNKNNGSYGNKGNTKTKDGNGSTFKRGNHSKGNNGTPKSHDKGSSNNGSKSKGKDSKHSK